MKQSSPLPVARWEEDNIIAIPESKSLEALDARIKSLEARREKLQRIVLLRGEIAALEGSAIMAGRADYRPLQIITATVSAALGLPLEQMFALRGAEQISQARQAIYLIAFELTDLNREAIRAYFHKSGGCVTHGIKAIRNRMDTDKAFAAKVARLTDACRERLAAGEGGG